MIDHPQISCDSVVRRNLKLTKYAFSGKLYHWPPLWQKNGKHRQLLCHRPNANSCKRIHAVKCPSNNLQRCRMTTCRQGCNGMPKQQQQAAENTHACDIVVPEQHISHLWAAIPFPPASITNYFIRCKALLSTSYNSLARPPGPVYSRCTPSCRSNRQT